ncbi:hypothetical protein IscW_ISCW003682 [Ixodes scapularis]|uniref:Uncharacterized protein n=1 Tax=Ixodes scapularis TaxID=6945 RepID=B7PFD7_IXOSC|nr:hypothetical protein IscW_ISCW003682 [Ixodes scapularis]|eukprot:XP_002433909.1 hypothetical protein IscW_ISCW003682 [Ixodes scapularis]
MRVTKSLNAQKLFTVILAFHEPYSDISSAWITGLPFPVQVWTRFGNREVEQLKNHSMSDTKVIVLVPSSTEHQRRVILEHLKPHIIYLSLVRLLFVLEPGDDLPYKKYPEGCTAPSERCSHNHATTDRTHRRSYSAVAQAVALPVQVANVRAAGTEASSGAANDSLQARPFAHTEAARPEESEAPQADLGAHMDTVDDALDSG